MNEQPASSAVTIRDVAARAGASIATASRALDERRPQSGPKADAVRKAAAELGYRRDAAASSLRRGTTGTVGVVVPRLTDLVMALLFEEIQGVCATKGLFALVTNTDDDPRNMRRAADMLLDRKVDGLILASARGDDEYTRELVDRGVNHVLALRQSGPSPAAVGDDWLGGYLAARHLIDLGHRNIGLIAGPPFASSVQLRTDGFHAALAEAGIDADPRTERAGSFSIEAGEQACSVLMRQRRGRPSAIFAMNDNTALGVLGCLARMGLSVPDDVSVVGYNDIPLASRLPTPLTSVRVPFRDIARSALQLLEEPVRSNVGVVLKATPSLIPRATTARPRRTPPA